MDEPKKGDFSKIFFIKEERSRGEDQFEIGYMYGTRRDGSHLIYGRK